MSVGAVAGLVLLISLALSRSHCSLSLSLSLSVCVLFHGLLFLLFLLLPVGRIGLPVWFVSSRFVEFPFVLGLTRRVLSSPADSTRPFLVGF